MNKSSLALFIICWLLIQPLQSMAQSEFPQWRSIGQAKLTVFWFDIYRAELFSASGRYDNNSDFLLSLTYLRAFEAKELIDETFDQFAQPIATDEAQRWRAALVTLWPDVRENDTISLLRNQQGHSIFFVNKQYVGQINEPKFTELFTAIWLADTSAYPKLAKQLKGQSND